MEENKNYLYLNFTKVLRICGKILLIMYFKNTFLKLLPIYVPTFYNEILFCFHKLISNTTLKMLPKAFIFSLLNRI